MLELSCKIDRFVALESSSVDILESTVDGTDFTVSSQTVNYVELVVLDENDEKIESDQGVPIGSWLKLQLVYREHSHRYQFNECEAVAPNGDSLQLLASTCPVFDWIKRTKMDSVEVRSFRFENQETMRFRCKIELCYRCNQLQCY